MTICTINQGQGKLGRSLKPIVDNFNIPIILVRPPNLEGIPQLRGRIEYGSPAFAYPSERQRGTFSTEAAPGRRKN